MIVDRALNRSKCRYFLYDCICYRLVGLVVRAADLGSIPAFAVNHFPSQAIAVYRVSAGTDWPAVSTL